MLVLYALLWRIFLKVYGPTLPGAVGLSLTSTSVQRTARAFAKTPARLSHRPIGLGRFLSHGMPGKLLQRFRAASDLCAAQGRCEAVLFVDIQAAYYEASRALLFHGDPDISQPPGEHLRHLSSLVSVLVQEGALQRLGVPPEEIALLQDCVAASHWTLNGSRNVYLASRGSRPGDGLADVLFGALFAIALRHIRHVCQSEGWAHYSAGALIGTSDEVLPLGWADDLAILSDYASPTDLQANFPRVAVVALSTLRLLRFRVNLGPGKTEAMLHIRGVRAKEVRGQMLGLDPRLHLCTGDELRHP